MIFVYVRVVLVLINTLIKRIKMSYKKNRDVNKRTDIIKVKPFYLNSRFYLLIVAFMLVYFDADSQKLNSENLIVKAVPSSLVRLVPVYGFNGNNTNGPNWSNKQFRDSVASLNLKIIRYPGGAVSNWWDWQNGWFEKQETLGGMKNNLKNMPFNPSGLEQLKLLVNQIHCDVIFTLNMISRNVKDQIAMLKHARALGIPIKWIELGNEFQLNKSVGRRIYATPAQYGKTCAQWITEIKKEFPNAKISVIGGNYNFTEDIKNWNEIVLKNAPGADAIVAHIYPIPKRFVDNAGINFQKLYIETRSNFTSQGFDNINSKINIWVTEYNVQWMADNYGQSNNEIQNNAFTWSQALSILLMSSELTEITNKTELIIDHNVSNTLVFAAINTKDPDFNKLPNGIGMEVWLKASNKMKTMRKINFFSAANGNHLLEDYKIFGWQFNNEHDSSILLVNLTGRLVTVNLNSITGNKPDLNFTTLYANKMSVIKSAKDVNRINSEIKTHRIDLPAYSITMLK